MVTRIEISSTVPDTRATVRTHQLKSLHASLAITGVQIIDIYTIEKSLTGKQRETITDMLTNPVTQTTRVMTDSHRPSLSDLPSFSWAIEIGFLPGVTDNVGNTTKEMIADRLKITFSDREGVYASQATLLIGNITKETAEKVALSLANPLIQRIHIKSAAVYRRDRGMDCLVPRVKIDTGTRVNTVNLEISDEELIRIGKQGIADADGTRRGPLALDLTYMKAIQAYFRRAGRRPTDMELESIAQTWSEHCKHTIFADPIDEIADGLYRHYIKRATNAIRKQKGRKDFCVSVFTDNSGAIVFDDQYLVTDKVETHNSPSALDPFGGAITGIVGVNRDALGFGLGAKPVANRYGFCFADPRTGTSLYRGNHHTQPLLSPRRIMDGVIAGVNAGGNQSGIPTMDGFVYFDPRYQGKPLVFVGTVGLIPRRVAGKSSYHKQARSGDYIVMVGGRVGIDGVHGATFSSEGLDSGSPATAVQIGDPITQKKMSDALVKEARDLGLFTSITDNGAGGLSCSVAEMAKESGGCLVQLELVPLKYPGLDPWQIWISESQERMTLAVPKRKWKRLSALLAPRGAEATVIGTFTDSGSCVVRYKKKTVMDIAMKFLHDGLPPRPMKTKQPAYQISPDTIPQPMHLAQTLSDLLSRPSIAGFSFISRQFDHTVQGGSVLMPLQGRGQINAEATVFRPVLSSPKGVVLSHGVCPSYSDYDVYRMAACAIDTAIRSSVAAGADPDRMAILDNFCWCSANEPERLWELKRAAQACYDYAVAYGTPFIAGKDSMFNDFKGYDAQGQPIKISIPPTLLISAISVMDDHTQAISLDAKMPGDLVYLLGETADELGGSEYYRMFLQSSKQSLLVGVAPAVAADRNRVLYHAVHQAGKKGLIASVLSVGGGGLAVTLAKTAIGGMLGMDVSLDTLRSALRIDHLLFSESQGRMIVTVAPENKKEFETVMKESACFFLGTVRTDTVFSLIRNKKPVLETTVEALHAAYTKTFTGY